MIALLIGVFLLGIALNGLFAGYETGFISADRIRVRHRAEEENDHRAQILLRELDNPEKMLTTVLIGTNVSLIFGTMAITMQMNNDLWATLIATPAYLIFAEIIPKSIFRAHPNRLSLKLLPAIRFFEKLLFVLIWPTVTMVKLLNRFARADTEDIMNPVMSSEEDFRNLVDESAARGSIEREEQAMIHSVMNLQKTQAKEIMVPRIDIQAVPESATRNDLCALFQESGRTRVPVYAESIDEICGVVNVYDVLLDDHPEDQSITRFIRDLLHVPATKPVDDLLQELKPHPQHMAVVTDEFGGTDGLITLEDVLEEIFGEIHDEHDPPQETIQQVGPNGFVIDARMSLEDAATVMGVIIKDDTVETVGGWVTHVAGRIPAQGEKLRHDGFRITILEGEMNHVDKVRVDVLADAPRIDATEPA